MSDLTRAIEETEPTWRLTPLAAVSWVAVFSPAWKSGAERGCPAGAVWLLYLQAALHLRSLDLSPTIVHRNFGFSWGINAWLLTPFIAKVGPERAGELRQRVADELHTPLPATTAMKCRCWMYCRPMWSLSTASRPPARNT